MAKINRKKRVSSLGSLRQPEEIAKSVEELTKTVVTPQPTVVPEKVTSTPPPSVSVVKSKPVAKAATKKKKKAPVSQVVKFAKLSDTHHMIAKIAAAKNRLSIKAYLEQLIEHDNKDAFK